MESPKRDIGQHFAGLVSAIKPWVNGDADGVAGFLLGYGAGMLARRGATNAEIRMLLDQILQAQNAPATEPS